MINEDSRSSLQLAETTGQCSHQGTKVHPNVIETSKRIEKSFQNRLAFKLDLFSFFLQSVCYEYLRIILFFLLDDSLSTTISWVLTTMDRALYFFSIELRSFCHRNPPPCCGFHQDILMKVSDESLGQRGGRLGTFFITECCENSVRMVVR